MDERSLFLAGLTAFLLVLLVLVERKLAPDLAQGSLAKRLLRAGQLVGLFAIAGGAARGAEAGVTLMSVAWTFGLAAVGLALLVAMGHIENRMLLGGRLGAEVERGNAAAGLAGGAHYAATGLLASVALAGQDLHGALLSFSFFLLAQLTLLAVIAAFRALTTYDDAEQIAGENTAAALSYSGVVLATAIVVARALEGDFVDWVSSLKAYGLVVATLAALYPVRQLFLQTLLLRAPFVLRGGRLDKGVGVERDIGLAALEAAGYVATALAIARVV